MQSLKPIAYAVLSLGGLLLFAGNASAQRPPPLESASTPRAVAAEPMSTKAFEENKTKLLEAKQVNRWAPKGSIKGQTGQFVVELTPQECTFLGGTVVYWAWCSDTYMKCVASNGREMCVDELKR